MTRILEVLPRLFNREIPGFKVDASRADLSNHAERRAVVLRQAQDEAARRLDQLLQ
jgi:hypothetical protein